MAAHAPLHVPSPLAEPTVRLACFAHAGGNPAVFRRWSGGLAPDVEMWLATLPGRGRRSREPLPDSWSPLIAEFADRISSDVAPPVALFGHSFGALVAFEVARELHRIDRPPAHLFVSGREAPTAANRVDLPADDESLMDHVDRLYGGIPASVREVPELVEHFAPLLRSDLRLLRDYVYRSTAPLPCPITAMLGTGDPAVTEQGLIEWRHQTSAAFDTCTFPGGHFYWDEQEDAVLGSIRRRVPRRIEHG